MLDKMQRALADGSHLFIRSWLLACLTIVSLSLLYVPVFSVGLGENPSEGAGWMVPVLTSLLFTLLIQPFLKAALIGSYGQVRQTPHITIKEFVAYGGRFYRPVLMLTLLLMLMGMVVGLVGVLIWLWVPKGVDLQQQSGLIVFASLLVIPFIELAPIMIVLKRSRTWQAVKDSYRLIGQYPLEMVPLIALFWGIPALLSWAIWGVPSIETLHQFGRMVIALPFLIVATPTMINYLAERIGPLESLDAPVAKIGISRPLAIGLGVALVFALVGVMVPVYLSLFPPRSLARPAELDHPRVVAGEALLSKSLFLEEARVGVVTDIRVKSGDAGIERRIAGRKGAVVVDAQSHVISAVTFDRRASEIQFIDVNGDGVFEYMDRGGHGWQDAALFDQAGKTLWRYGGMPGVDDMTAGDLDGDGKPEFVVGFNGGGGVRLLNGVGKVEWQEADRNVWHVEIIDTNGDGTPEIVHSNASGQITIRDWRGGIINRVRPHEPGLYFSGFSVARWPDKNSRPCLLVPGDGKVWLLDFQGNKVVELNAPNSNLHALHADVTGLHVKFGGDHTDYFVVLVNYDLYGRAILYLYRPSLELGELVYQEILPESAASLATVTLDQSGTEALLVGGNGKVWRYELRETGH